MDCQGTCCLCEILQRTERELLSVFCDESEKQGQKNENFPVSLGMKQALVRVVCGSGLAEPGTSGAAEAKPP